MDLMEGQCGGSPEGNENMGKVVQMMQGQEVTAGCLVFIRKTVNGGFR